MKKPMTLAFWTAQAVAMLGLFTLGCGGGSKAVLTFNHPQEKILFTSQRALDGSDGGGGPSNLWVVNADGTDATPLTTLTAANSSNPAWSPDGTKIAFISNRAPDGSDGAGYAENMWIMNADDFGAALIAQSGGMWPDGIGSLAWAPDGTKIAYELIRGEPAPCSIFDCGCTHRRHNVHPNSTPLTPLIATGDLYVINADGSGAALLAHSCAGDMTDRPTWSPDGTQIAFYSWQTIWVINRDDTHETEISASGVNPVWSPDGRKIAFISVHFVNHAVDTANLWVVNADGSGAQALTANTTSGVISDGPAWSPDGARIVFSSSQALDGSNAANTNLTKNIWVMNADGSGAKPLTSLSASGADSADAAWSPDGKKIAFDSSRALDGSNAANANNTSNVWVINSDSTNPIPLTKITATGANSSSPQWRP